MGFYERIKENLKLMGKDGKIIKESKRMSILKRGEWGIWEESRRQWGRGARGFQGLAMTLRKSSLKK